MQSKKSCRFTAAFIGFLLLMLSILVLPVSAADSEMPPSAGGVEITNGTGPDGSTFDFGELTPEEVLAGQHQEVTLTNLTGNRVDLVRVSLWDAASSEYKEITIEGNVYNGNTFGVYGSKYLDTEYLQTVSYILEPIRLASVIIPREEPYEDRFQMVFQGSDGKGIFSRIYGCYKNFRRRLSDTSYRPPRHQRTPLRRYERNDLRNG